MARKSVFHAKHFTVHQDRCAMKVSTDGILLGCLAEIEGARRILDIGTGTGILALMAAQRNQQGLIDAIETNRDACGQARENFAASPWAERIRTVHQDVLTYEPEFPYDAIICNPPYYEDDLRSPDSARNMARHSEELSLEKLVEQCDRLLAVGGSVSCILPFERMSKLVELLTLNNLVISVVNNVKYVEGGPVRRVVLTLTRQRTQLRESTIEVQDTDNRYTDQYQQLTKDFLLKVRSD